MPNPGDYRRKKNVTMTIKQMVICAAIVFSASVSAQVQQRTEAPEKAEKAHEIELLELAGKLVGYGQKTKSALPLIQAVQIYRQLNVVEEDGEASMKSTSPYEAQLLTEATKYASGNKAVLELIKDAGKATRAGAQPGPIRHIASIGPEEVKERKIYANEGKYVTILLDGQGEGIREKDKDGNILVSDLRLKVFDRNGHTIATDQSAGENCSVSFITRTSSTLTVEIKNVGKLRDDYILYIYCD